MFGFGPLEHYYYMGMEKTGALDGLDIPCRVHAVDAAAFTAIVQRFQSPIVSYLFHLTGDAEIARDLAQDTFIRAYKALPRTTTDLPLKTWLYRIATNTALQYHRRRAIVSFVPLDDGLKTIANIDPARAATEAAAVHEALLKVPQRLRVCMVLHFVDGFKHREIAKMLGISEDAARMRVARGSEEFRRLYGTSRGDFR
jgi:RNA polymerase sigma-70 factor (ECF subfamily)